MQKKNKLSMPTAFAIAADAPLSASKKEGLGHIFETASFHIVKPCNMKCKFCYATFDDMRISRQLPAEAAMDILAKLKDAGVQKITFAGGEPLLYKRLDDLILFAKHMGFVTSIITNGSLLSYDRLERWKGILDWIGISVDSLSEETNKKIGRDSKTNPDYYDLVDSVKLNGFSLKVNTVVNRFNEHEYMGRFIEYANPDRWKIFDTLRVEGQNQNEFEGIRTTPGGFESFVSRHSHHSMVVEDNESMTGSYLLIDPQGRLFENSKGRHTYSDPLHNSDIETCLSQITLNRYNFIKRGGIYNW